MCRLNPFEDATVDIDRRAWKSPDGYARSKHDALVRFYECMACCHSLARVDGQLVGDPLETEMFKTSEWCFDDGGDKC